MEFFRYCCCVCFSPGNDLPKYLQDLERLKSAHNYFAANVGHGTQLDSVVSFPIFSFYLLYFSNMFMYFYHFWFLLSLLLHFFVTLQYWLDLLSIFRRNFGFRHLQKTSYEFGCSSLERELRKILQHNKKLADPASLIECMGENYGAAFMFNRLKSITSSV